MTDKKEHAKTLIRMPPELMQRLKTHSTHSGQSLNTIMVECITDGMNRREGNTLTDIIQDGNTAPQHTTQPQTPDSIQDGPTQNIERGLVTMAPDIIQDAKDAVTLYEDAPARIREWTERGRDISKAMDAAAQEAAMNQRPQLPNTTPQQEAAPIVDTQVPAAPPDNTGRQNAFVEMPTTPAEPIEVTPDAEQVQGPQDAPADA